MVNCFPCIKTFKNLFEIFNKKTIKNWNQKLLPNNLILFTIEKYISTPFSVVTQINNEPNHTSIQFTLYCDKINEMKLTLMVIICQFWATLNVVSELNAKRWNAPQPLNLITLKMNNYNIFVINLDLTVCAWLPNHDEILCVKNVKIDMETGFSYVLRKPHTSMSFGIIISWMM